MARIGVLALQGGFAAHAQVLYALGHDVVLIRDAAQIAEVDGLVFPGGESTTQLKLILRFGLRTALDAHHASGKPVLATCAGLILLARQVSDPSQASLGWLDVQVRRNAWGRQVESFEAVSDEGTLPLVFIRAPRIVSVGGEVELLASYHGEPVLVRQGRVLGATFHPELTSAVVVHAQAFGQL
ncbi:MAG: pyridoxal 5'-phosphate synthase glutaminase subunit PdxT [Myxococcota bacterium]